MTRLHSIAVLITLVSLCGSGCHPNDPPKHVERPAGPGPGDSLAKLSRLLLDDPDPVAIAQALICENLRLIELHGPQKANTIARKVEDTIYTGRDRAARRRVDGKLANRVFRSECAPVSSEAHGAVRSQ